MIKQGFQFLNTLCLSLKDKRVFPVRKGNKIHRTIVVLDSVKMVNNPAIRQRLIVNLLPNKNMLHDIARTTCVMMRRLVNQNISSFISYSTTFPLWVFFRGAISQMLCMTSTTSFRSSIAHFITTLRTDASSFGVSHNISSTRLFVLWSPIIFILGFFVSPVRAGRAICPTVVSRLKGILQSGQLIVIIFCLSLTL